MGGEGSGRKPDVFKMVTKRNDVSIGDNIILPVTSHIRKPALKASSSSYITDTEFSSLSGAYNTHAGDSSDPHGALLTQTNMTTSGTISGANIIVTGDHTTTSGAKVVNVVYSTGATPDTASGYPIGTLFVQYTA